MQSLRSAVKEVLEIIVGLLKDRTCAEDDSKKADKISMSAEISIETSCNPGYDPICIYFLRVASHATIILIKRLLLQKQWSYVPGDIPFLVIDSLNDVRLIAVICKRD